MKTKLLVPTDFTNEAHSAIQHAVKLGVIVQAEVILLNVVKDKSDIPAATNKLKEEKLPYISFMTDPIYGGVSASLAMLGDINIAEPKAQVGFAGPRVIEDTVRVKLPEGFQRSEFLLEHGLIDMIVHRSEIKDKLYNLLSKLSAN